MSIRVRRPATARLELSDGDYLLVKQDLTAGEYHAVQRAATRPLTMTPGTRPEDMVAELDPIAGGLATVLAYLLDWSFQDADGKRLAIADQPQEVVKAALEHIDFESYMEIQKAIQAHQAARKLAIEAEKKTSNGATAPASTLASVG